MGNGWSDAVQPTREVSPMGCGHIQNYAYTIEFSLRGEMNGDPVTWISTT